MSQPRLEQTFITYLWNFEDNQLVFKDMSTFIYSEDDNENRQCSPILIPEKPLNSILTFGSTPQPSRLNSSSAGKHNTTADVLKPSTKDSEFQAVTIPRAKLKQLINALGASVHLLQESVDPVRSRSFLETDFEDDIDEDNDSDAADGRNTKYLNMKAPSRWRIKHNHETLAEAFNQGQISPSFEFISCTDNSRVWSLVL